MMLSVWKNVFVVDRNVLLLKILQSFFEKNFTTKFWLLRDLVDSRCMISLSVSNG